jgi:hypothetical protein
MGEETECENDLEALVFVYLGRVIVDKGGECLWG